MARETLEKNGTTFHGTKIETRDEGDFIVCVCNSKSNPIFFYMNKKGRIVSKGDTNSSTGNIDSSEYGRAKKWPNAKVEKLTAEELPFVVAIAEEIQKDPFYGYSEANHIAHAEALQRRLEKAMHTHSNK